ncbi:MAG TPA: LCP family protein [Actinophytocola sp.]|uniref:LCP family protein n=1 Tax=Actinophytocola sp. TaxID=1872138 RepID=UPI002DDD730D|nr:LCP family protein [Actinophytocola sp.]HEV2779275.1 LCP family protein [Actinophytocola sp.]
MSYGPQGPPRRPGHGSTRRMEVPGDQQLYGDRGQYGADQRLYGDRGQRAYEDQYQYGDRQQYADQRRYGDQRRPGDRPPPGGYGAPPRPRPRRRRRFGRVLLIIFLAFVVLIGAVWLYLDLNLNRVQALTDYPGRPAAGAGTNWLIVGSDSRAGLSAEDQERLATGDAKGQRTDTMMLLHIPDNDTKPTLVSLLRDSYVDIPGKGKNKLNAAYAFGGPKLLAQTVELNTGLRLDHYMEIGFGGFAEIVDSIGGVEMCLKEPIDDPKAGIKLPAGCQELTGEQALGYVRTRATPRADYDRVIHQREFIGALTDKAASAGTLLNPFKLFPLLANAPDAITVDEGDHLHNLPGLAFAIKGASDGSTVSTTVPVGRNVGSALQWDEAKKNALFDALRTDQPVPDSALVDCAC